MTDLTRDVLDRPLASKEFIIHVHGQEHTSVETWNEGAKVDAKLDRQIQVKVTPHYRGASPKFNGSIESVHQSSYDSKDPNIERSSRSQFDGLDPRVQEPNWAQNMSPNLFRKANNHAAAPSTSGGGPQPHLIDAQYCLKEK